MAFSFLGLISRSRGYGVVSNLSHRSLSSLSSVSSRVSPGLMLQPSTIEETGNPVFEFFSLAENRVLKLASFHFETLLGSSQGWLGVNRGECNLGLINPFTHCGIKLPSMVTPDPLEMFPRLFPSKITVSCPPDDDDDEEEQGQGECRALLNYGPYEDLLAFCCPGRSSKWTAIGGAQYSGSTTVYSRWHKLFFCTRVDQLGGYDTPQRGVYLEAWDLRDPLSPKMIQMSPNLDCSLRSDGDDADTKDFLVINDDTDDLFLVRRLIKAKTLDLLSVTGHIDRETYDYHRYHRVVKPTEHRYSMRRYYHDHKYDDDSRPYKTITFDVHKYDPESRSFRYMDPLRGSSLDGLSFFIDENNGFAVSAKEFPELKPDSIYFTAWCPPAWDDTNFGGYDLGVYNYKDATISPCYYPSYSHRFRTMALGEPWWIIPNTTTTTKPSRCYLDTCTALLR